MLKSRHAAQDKHSEHEANRDQIELFETLKDFRTLFYDILTCVVSLISRSMNLPKKAVLLRP